MVAHVLSRGRRQLLVVLPGHGIADPVPNVDHAMESRADLVAEVLRNFGAAAADLVAHSMGEAVALMPAHRHPDLVARPVLVDADPDPTPPDLGGAGSGMMRARSEAEFLSGVRTVMADRDPSRWATVRWADPVGRCRSGGGTVPGRRSDDPEPVVHLGIAAHPPDVGRRRIDPV